MDGMFMDAVMYSAVGRNLASGEGSFWFPYFTEAHMQSASFHENPPLGYGLMTLFYSVFGSGIHTERIFAGASFVITAILIVKFWRMLWPTHYKMAWLPVLLWAIIPVVHWSFRNNMMENIMGIFILGSSMASYRAFKAEERHIYWSAWAGLLAVCAFLVKGVPGLFIWATPVALAIASRKSYGKAILHTGILMGTGVLAFLLIYLYDPARESLEIYLFERTSQRLSEGATTESRFSILRIMVENLALPGILTLLAGLIASRVNGERMQWDSVIGFLTVMGIAGSIPFTFTLVQRGFYLVPVFPFFALALGSVLRPVIEKTTSKWRRNPVLQIAGWVMIGLGVSVSVYTAGMIKRDRLVIEDVRILRDNLPEKTILLSDDDINADWTFKAYLERYARVRLSDRITPADSQYRITRKGASSDAAHPHLSEVSRDLKGFDLYESEK